MNVPLKIEILNHFVGLPTPEYAHAGDSGFDLRAAIRETVTIPPQERVLIPTGLRFEIPDGYEIQVRPRSGLALHCGVTTLNTPGTIDAGYRGEVQVILYNADKECQHSILRGDRIAQAVLAPVGRALMSFEFVDTSTKRGEGGFGSTGHA